MLAFPILIGIVAVFSSAVPRWRENQEPLSRGKQIASPAVHGADEVMAKLVLAEIVPTVVSRFTPLLSITIRWSKATASLGNTIKPKQLQDEPAVALEPFSSNGSVVYEQVVLVLTDPDAKSRDNPIWAEFCHWIAYWPPHVSETTSKPIFRSRLDVSPSRSSSLPPGQVQVDEEDQDPSQKQDVVPYKPPSPPEKTWKHRYVFLALTPRNGTVERLNLTVPNGRQRWGNGKARTGVRQWAEENGLAVVGANFLYSEHKKQ
ncbi:OV-16 antigen [Sphaceloma murrayae]|uniref:OV-16 antigen n=1 Tax=Sphaceloma murrayae TaxID=2082308 RepID=A0A2K1QL42_9PEZI|nr:OV-16 antigen [Sphaceloma murrayae]